MERFARAADDLSRDHAPTDEEVVALAEAHGVEITRSIEDATTNAAYLTVARFSGDPDELLGEYQKTSDTMSAVGRDHGMILHAGAKTASGFLVLNLWPSKDCSEAAANDPRRLAVLARADISPDQI